MARAGEFFFVRDNSFSLMRLFFEIRDFLFLVRFENVYMDGDIRVAKDIRGDYLVVDRAPFNWRE